MTQPFSPQRLDQFSQAQSLTHSHYTKTKRRFKAANHKISYYVRETIAQPNIDKIPIHNSVPLIVPRFIQYTNSISQLLYDLAPIPYSSPIVALLRSPFSVGYRCHTAISPNGGSPKFSTDSFPGSRAFLPAVYLRKKME